MATFPGINQFREAAISKHLLRVAPQPEDREWMANMEKVIPLIGPAEFMAICALDTTLQAQYDPEQPDYPIPPLPKDLFSIPENYTPETYRSERRQALLALPSNPYFDIKELEGLTRLNGEEVSLIPQLVNHMLEHPGQIEEQWEEAIKMIRACIQAKHTMELVQIEARKEAHKLEQERLEQAKERQRITENEKWMPRVRLTFPELVDHPWAGRIFEDRQRIAADVVLLEILYHNSPDLIPAHEFNSVFSLLKKYLPDNAMRYPIKLSPELRKTYSKDELHNLYLYLINATRLAFDNPLDPHTIPGDIESELTELINFQADYLLQNPHANKSADIDMDDLKAMLIQAGPGMNPVEQLMRRLWGKRRVPKLDTNFYQEYVEPLIWQGKTTPRAEEERFKKERHKALFNSF